MSSIDELLFHAATCNYPDLGEVQSLIDENADVFWHDPQDGSILHSAYYWVRELGRGWKTTDLLWESISLLENEICKQLFEILQDYLIDDLANLVVEIYILTERSES